MDDPLGVGGGETARELFGNREELLRRESPAGSSSRRFFPSTNSIAMKKVPSEGPNSWMVTMFGWLSDEAARASFSRRGSRAGSEAYCSPEGT